MNILTIYINCIIIVFLGAAIGLFLGNIKNKRKKKIEKEFIKQLTYLLSKKESSHLINLRRAKAFCKNTKNLNFTRGAFAALDSIPSTFNLIPIQEEVAVLAKDHQDFDQWREDNFEVEGGVRYNFVSRGIRYIYIKNPGDLCSRRFSYYLETDLAHEFKGYNELKSYLLPHIKIKE